MTTEDGWIKIDKSEKEQQKQREARVKLEFDILRGEMICLSCINFRKGKKLFSFTCEMGNFGWVSYLPDLGIASECDDFKGRKAGFTQPQTQKKEPCN